MKRYGWTAAFGLLFCCVSAFGQSSQDLITFDAPAAPDSIVATIGYNGQAETVAYKPYWTTTDAHTSIQHDQWQYSLDGGSTWKGPDGTSSTYYSGLAYDATLSSGTLEARVRGQSADYGTGAAQYSSWTDSGNVTYAAPSYPPTGSAGGDLSSSYPSPTVVGAHDNVTTVSGTYTAALTDTLIEANCSGGNFTITLPAAATAGKGKLYIVENTDPTNSYTVSVAAAGTDTIYGIAGDALGVNHEYKAYQLVGDGVSSWRVTAWSEGEIAAYRAYVSGSSTSVPGFAALTPLYLPNYVSQTSVAHAASPYTVQTTDYNLMVNGASNVTVDLPQASAEQGREIGIIDTGTSGTITVTPRAGDTINLASTYSLSLQGWYAIVVSDGVSNWYIVAEGVGGTSLLTLTGASAFDSWALSGDTYTESLTSAPADSWWGNGTGSTATPSYNTSALPASLMPSPTSSTLGGIESLAAASHKWINAVSTSGVPTQTQPAFTDISGTAAASQLPNPTASTLGGVESIASASHKWISAISTSGVPGQTQPAFADISGTAAASQLPSPTASTIGGVESIASTTNEWVNAISTSGVPTETQPAFSNLSGTASASQLPAFVAAGSSHAQGAVPDPGSTSHSTGPYYLGDDANFHQISAGTGIALNWASSGAGAVTITANGATSNVVFPVYSASTTYAAGNVVQGSDSNLYVAQGSTTGNNPVGDIGANWKLYELRANLTLLCGVNEPFADTFAASSSPGGAMTPGMISALAFVDTASGAVSPAVATLTLQQQTNPSFSASANGTTSTIKTATNIATGTNLIGYTGTAGNIGEATVVTGSSYSSPTYTLTVSPSLTSSTATWDTFLYAPYYGANTITVNLPTLGPNTTIVGSTNNVAAPAFYPSVSAGGSGGAGWTSPGYFAITYTWADATGTTRETLPGPVTSATISAGQKPTIAGFNLPTGATGANLYYSSTPGGALGSKMAFSVSGGVASALTPTSPGSGAAPTSDPSPAAYTDAMCWQGGDGFNIQAGLGLNMNGLMLYGNNSGRGIYVGHPLIGANWLRAASLAVGTATIVSDWATVGIEASYGDAVYAGSVDADACGIGFQAANQSLLVATNANAVRNTTGFNAQGMSYVSAISSFDGFGTTGYLTQNMSEIALTTTAPANGTADNGYDNTIASPAVNSITTSGSSGSGTGNLNAQ